MKKLMFAAMAVALAGAASAVEAYTYKASIKHTYLKTKTTTKLLNTTVAKTTVHVKYTKTTTLDGYLIQDDEELLRVSGLSAITGAATELQPGNRCFLVVRNKGAEKGYRAARILPGVIDAKWYDDKLTAPGTSPAQGYLYIGGEIVTGAYLGTTFNALDGVEVAGYVPRVFTEWQRRVPIVRTPTIGIDDYFFTSAYLFGQYNEPAWNAGVVLEYGDTWMNHAGLGKAGYYNTIKYCCNRGTGGAGTVLDSLAGNLKAGFYICTENGDNDTHSQTIMIGANAWPVLRTGLLEDQLWKGVRVNDPTLVLTAPWALAVAYKTTLQGLDMWGDGNLDLRTTDVGSGTWSIKRTTALQSVALTAAQIATIQGTWAFATDYNGATGTAKPLIDAINGALVALKTGNPLFGNVFDVDVSGKSNAQAMINYSFYRNYLR